MSDAVIMLGITLKPLGFGALSACRRYRDGRPLRAALLLAAAGFWLWLFVSLLSVRGT
jgi:hypothetical protein